MDKTEFIEYLKVFVKNAGSQKAAAENLEISTAYLSDVLNGRRDPGRKILACFDLRAVITYVQEKETAEYRYQ